MSSFKFSDQTKRAVQKSFNGLLSSASIEIEIDGEMLHFRVVDPEGRELGRLDPVRVGRHSTLTIRGLEVKLAPDFEWR
jgi:hypothetical protein